MPLQGGQSNQNIEESTIYSLFASGYETKVCSLNFFRSELAQKSKVQNEIEKYHRNVGIHLALSVMIFNLSLADDQVFNIIFF